MNFAQFLREHFFVEHLLWLLLHGLPDNMLVSVYSLDYHSKVNTKHVFFTVMVYDMKMLMFGLKNVSKSYLSTYKTVSVRFLKPIDQPSLENKRAGDPNKVVHYNIFFL